MCTIGNCWMTMILWSLFLLGALTAPTLAYFPAEGDLCPVTASSDDFCEYDFMVRRVQTLTYTVTNYTGKGYPPIYDVAFNETIGQYVIIESGVHVKYNPDTGVTDEYIGKVVDAERDNIITADGVKRDVIVINNMFPGPTIRVLAGAKVRVTVHNELVEVMSLHWHGMYQKGTNFMDGVPYVTQCPILPNQIYTYMFVALPSGAHWYHSHYHTQRLDGLCGMIVVYAQPLPFPEHAIILSDWYHFDSDEMYVSNAFGLPFQGSGSNQIALSFVKKSLDGVEIADWLVASTLIGGRGRFNASEYQQLPLQKYTLVQNQTRKFGVANTGAVYAFEIIADGHVMTLVACDGYSIQPIQVDSIIIFPGETVDFEIFGDQDPSRSYWLQARQIAKDPDYAAEGGKAILVYKNSLSNGDPVSIGKVCTKANPCKVFNCPYKDGSAINKTCISPDTLRSIETPEYLKAEFGVGDSLDNVDTYFLNFAFNPGWTASVNARNYKSATNVLIKNPNAAQYEFPCNESECNENGCVCSHSISLTYNRTIELILTNYDITYNNAGHHSIHLHGHGFAVLYTGYAPQDTTGLRSGYNDDVQCDETASSWLCSRTIWNVNRGRPAHLSNASSQPVIKDVIVVPGYGYTVVRFRSNNPGMWLLHCHMEIHSKQGMTLVFDEASDLHPSLPANLPTCADFQWSMQDFNRYLSRPISDGATTLPNLLVSTISLLLAIAGLMLNPYRGAKIM